MKTEIVLWYYDRGFPIQKLINQRPKGVRPSQIKAAMIELYQNWDGSNIGLGHKVKEIASKMNDKEIIEDELESTRVKEQALFYKNKYDGLRNWFIGSMGLWLWLGSLLIVHFLSK